jgi:hypothetical protein
MIDLKLSRLDQAAAFLQPSLRELHARAARVGILLFVVFVWRSPAEQWRLYQQGRVLNRETEEWEPIDPVKRTGIVTNARPWEAPHCVTTLDGQPAAVAADFVPMDKKTGKLLWDAQDTVWQRFWELASKVGLDPLGDKWGAYYEGDRGHVEEPGWRLKLAGLGLTLPERASVVTA